MSLVPGMDFGTHEPERWLRLSYANSRANLELAVQRLEDWLAAR